MKKIKKALVLLCGTVFLFLIQSSKGICGIDIAAISKAEEIFIRFIFFAVGAVGMGFIILIIDALSDGKKHGMILGMSIFTGLILIWACFFIPIPH